MELIYPHLVSRVRYTRADFCARMRCPVLVYRPGRFEGLAAARTRSQIYVDNAFSAELLALNNTMRKEAHQYWVHRLDCADGQEALIGRATGNKIVVNDKSVSKVHAKIEASRQGVFVIDQGSKNGTRVAERVLQPGERFKLASGDVMFLGAFPIWLFMPADFYDFLGNLVEEVRPSHSAR